MFIAPNHTATPLGHSGRIINYFFSFYSIPTIFIDNHNRQGAVQVYRCTLFPELLWKFPVVFRCFSAGAMFGFLKGTCLGESSSFWVRFRQHLQKTSGYEDTERITFSGKGRNGSLEKGKRGSSRNKRTLGHIMYFGLSPSQKGAERAAGSTMGKKYSWHVPNVWGRVVPESGWVGTRTARLMLVNPAVRERKAQEWVSLRKMFVVSCVSGCHVNRMWKPGKREESKIGRVVWEKQGINCTSRDWKDQWAFEKRGKYYFYSCHFFLIFVFAKLLWLLQKQGVEPGCRKHAGIDGQIWLKGNS